MKTKLLIIALLVSVSATAQVRNYKANQNELLNSFESGQISKEAYIDMTRFQVNGLTDSIQISIQKPHYNLCLDLAMIGGGAALASISFTIDIDKLFKKIK